MTRYLGYDGPMFVTAVLAAGGSLRMGRPKQLLMVGGQPLLQIAVNAARGLGSRAPVVVVLGASSDAISSQINLDGCRILQNSDWATGMASSIKIAVSCVRKDYPRAKGILLMVGDQPRQNTQLLQEILDQFVREQAPAVVSAYGYSTDNNLIFGPPAVFSSELFDQLLDLQGDSGARKVALSLGTRLRYVSFPEGLVDIDTEDDYRAL